MITGNNRGLSLISVIVAVAILAIALTMAASAFIGASRLTQRAARLTAASSFAKGVMEQAVSRGFDRVKTAEVRDHLPDLPRVKCSVDVSLREGLKQVIVTLSWQDDGRPRDVRFCTLLAKGRAR